MTILATVTQQRQLNLPIRAMEQYFPSLKTGGQVLLSFEPNRITIEPVQDFIEFVESHRSKTGYAKNKSLKEILLLEKKAIEDARMERYLAKQKRENI